MLQLMQLLTLLTHEVMITGLRLMLHTLLFMDYVRSAQKKMIKKSVQLGKQNERRSS